MKKFLVLVVLSATLIACHNIPISDYEYNSPYVPGDNYALDHTTDELYIQITENAEHPFVVLIVQGGPFEALSFTSIDDPILSSTSGINLKNFMSKYSVVMVHQLNTIDDVFKNEKIVEELSLQDRKDINAANIEIIMRVAQKFKKEGKRVLLYGASYGALLIQHLLETYEVTDVEKIFDKVCIAVGRINPSDREQNDVNNDYIVRWNDIGEYNPYDPPKNETDLLRLAYPVLKNYVESLHDKSFSTNKFIYISAQNDGSIGRMLPDEIAFLQEKFTNYYMLKNAPHEVFFTEGFLDLMADFAFLDKLPSSADYTIENDYLITIELPEFDSGPPPE